jgi:O-antigen ligase
LFAFTALFSLLFQPGNLKTNELIIAFFYTVRFFSYLVSATAIYNLVKHGDIAKDYIYKSILFSGVIISIAGFIQLVVLPDFGTLDISLGWDPHKNRLASTFFDPNFTGAYLSICLIIILDKFFRKMEKGQFAYVTSAALIIIYALFLTFSRSAWLMAAVVIFVFGLLKSRWLLFFSILLAFSAYYAVPRIQTRISGITDPADSAHYRFVSWINTGEIIKDHWLTGVGFNTMRYVQKDYGFLDYDTLFTHSGAGSDSSLLFVFATTGIVGFLVYILGFVLPLFESFSNLKKIDPLMSALIVSLLIGSLFINSLFYPQIMSLWMTLFAINSDVDKLH